MNIWFLVSMILGLYYAGALFFSVAIDMAIKRELNAGHFKSVEELGSVALGLTSSTLFWPLSLVRAWLETKDERKAKRAYRKLKRRTARDMRLAEKKAREGK